MVARAAPMTGWRSLAEELVEVIPPRKTNEFVPLKRPTISVGKYKMNQPQPLIFRGTFVRFRGSTLCSPSWVLVEKRSNLLSATSNHEAEGAAVGQVLLNMSSTICCPSPTTSFLFRRGDVGRVEHLIKFLWQRWMLKKQ